MVIKKLRIAKTSITIDAIMLLTKPPKESSIPIIVRLYIHLCLNCL